jgi:MFS family permease
MGAMERSGPGDSPIGEMPSKASPRWRGLPFRAARGLIAGGSSAFAGARRFTHAGGAGESGLARLLELHAFSTAGDAAIAVSLAGTLFFTVPTEQASGQVALFLAVTMLPFAIVAPLIGPFLDRFRRGRRWAIGTTMAIRGFCCWVLATAVVDESPAFYVAALACLVASKAYGITRAAAVPRLLPEASTLVKANSRISLTGTAAAALSAPLAVGFAAIGPSWSLRYAFVLFVIATILAIVLPEQVDSVDAEEHETIRLSPGIPISRAVVNGLRCNVGVRLLTGFLVIHMAFVLRAPPDALNWPGHPTILMALVIGAAGFGNAMGVALGALTRSHRPERVVVASLALVTCAVLVAALLPIWPLMIGLGLAAGLCQSLAKLSLDALIQRDVDEAVRTSMFARSETLLQLAWVIGGLLGIGLFVGAVPLSVALASVGAVLALGLLYVVRRLLAERTPRKPAAGQPSSSVASRRSS